MKYVTPDFDITSPDPSDSSGSPTQQVYYVQSPSRDSHEEAKTSSSSATAFMSPTSSPSLTASSQYTRSSSASRVSTSMRKGRFSREYRGWRPQFRLIEEEEGEIDGRDGAWLLGCPSVMAMAVLVVMFVMCCLVVWGVSKPYKPQVSVLSMKVNEFYKGEGVDRTGVPTKMVTIKCKIKLRVHNPSPFFGIHVSSSPIHLLYYNLVVASGQVERYYQERESWRAVSVNIEGNQVPLYGAGIEFAAAAATASSNTVGVPLRLQFQIKFNGYVFGKWIQTNHLTSISCPFSLHSLRSPRQFVSFQYRSCTYT